MIFVMLQLHLPSLLPSFFDSSPWTSLVGRCNTIPFLSSSFFLLLSITWSPALKPCPETTLDTEIFSKSWVTMECTDFFLIFFIWFQPIQEVKTRAVVNVKWPELTRTSLTLTHFDWEKLCQFVTLVIPRQLPFFRQIGKGYTLFPLIYPFGRNIP